LPYTKERANYRRRNIAVPIPGTEAEIGALRDSGKSYSAIRCITTVAPGVKHSSPRRKKDTLARQIIANCNAFRKWHMARVARLRLRSSLAQPRFGATPPNGEIMRAVMLHSLSHPPALVETAQPQPKPGEVLIQVAACGLNFADLLMAQGKYQERADPPFVMGMEVAGQIAAIGSDVSGFRLGQRVAAFVGRGGLAEYVCCAATRCVALPDSLSMPQAAGFLVAYGTSHLALRHRAGLQAGETLLVLGAAGGVGLTAVEIGHALGARVIAVARGAARLEIARKAGADACLDSETPDFGAALKDMGGVDVVFDAVGEPLATPALRALRPEGRFLTIGFAGGKVPQFPANILLVKNLTVLGLYWGGYLNFAPDALIRSLREVLDWQVAGKIHPHISHILPLEHFADGFELLRSRKSSGKVVIQIAP
jgi:NADPH2:quinone reductase